jgi:hypothetical protein
MCIGDGGGAPHDDGGGVGDGGEALRKRARVSPARTLDDELWQTLEGRRPVLLADHLKREPLAM